METETIKPQAYSSCSDLPLYNFVQISLTKDLTWLIIAGEPDNLVEIWEEIKDEYANISKDTSNTHLLNMQVGIDTLNKRLIIIEAITEKLKEKRSEELINLLRFDLYFPFTYVNLERDLKLTITQSKSDILKLKKLEAEFKAFIDEQAKDSTEISLQEYQEQMTMLSKWQACRYTLKDTTVAEYLALIHRFNAENK